MTDQPQPKRPPVRVHQGNGRGSRVTTYAIFLGLPSGDRVVGTVVYAPDATHIYVDLEEQR